MKRRNFLKVLGIGALAVPVVKEIIAEPIAPAEPLCEGNLLDAMSEYQHGSHLIKLTSPVRPSKAGEAIYIHTQNGDIRENTVVKIPGKYFDTSASSTDYLVTSIVTIGTGFDTHVYKCLPFYKDLALIKEIPVNQGLVTGGHLLSNEY